MLGKNEKRQAMGKTILRMNFSIDRKKKKREK